MRTRLHLASVLLVACVTSPPRSAAALRCCTRCRSGLRVDWKLDLSDGATEALKLGRCICICAPHGLIATLRMQDW